MSTLITGSDGFVGKHLMPKLKNAVGFDLKKNQDIRNLYQLDEYFETNNITEVVHLAARAGVRRSKNYPEEYISTNILGTQNIVNMCNKYNVKKLVFFSSSSVYGCKVKLPVRETDEKNPISLYGITKLACEHIVNNALCPTVTLIPFTIYGENPRGDSVLGKWIKSAKDSNSITIYGDTNSTRGYVYVEDIIDLVVKLIKKEWTFQHEIFNIGGSEVISLGDIVKLFEKKYENLKIHTIDRCSEDIVNQYANITKAKTYFSFNPVSRYKLIVEDMLNQ